MQAGLQVVACGAINWDITVFVPRLPTPGEEVVADRIARVPGGTAANVAVAAARLLGHGHVGFLGAVGADEIGRQQRAILEQEGVHTGGLLTIEGAESGQAYVLVDLAGRNVIASLLGANLALRPDHFSAPQAQEALTARVYAVTDPPLAMVDALLEVANKTRAQVMWGPGVQAAHPRAAVKDLARRVNVLLLNETEAGQLTGEEAPKAVSRKLLAAGWRNQCQRRLRFDPPAPVWN